MTTADEEYTQALIKLVMLEGHIEKLMLAGMPVKMIKKDLSHVARGLSILRQYMNTADLGNTVIPS